MAHGVVVSKLTRARAPIPSRAWQQARASRLLTCKERFWSRLQPRQHLGIGLAFDTALESTRVESRPAIPPTRRKPSHPSLPDTFAQGGYRLGNDCWGLIALCSQLCFPSALLVLKLRDRYLPYTTFHSTRPAKSPTCLPWKMAT
jgi:hypothetical protein